MGRPRPMARLRPMARPRRSRPRARSVRPRLRPLAKRPRPLLRSPRRLPQLRLPQLRPPRLRLLRPPLPRLRPRRPPLRPAACSSRLRPAIEPLGSLNSETQPSLGPDGLRDGSVPDATTAHASGCVGCRRFVGPPAVPVDSAPGAIDKQRELWITLPNAGCDGPDVPMDGRAATRDALGRGDPTLPHAPIALPADRLGLFRPLSLLMSLGTAPASATSSPSGPHRTRPPRSSGRRGPTGRDLVARRRADAD
jgi:hypothetical protein